MFEWARSLSNYVSGLVYPQPPAGAAYGFRWQAGQGVPGALTIYDVAGGAVPAGVYVVFAGNLLDNLTDPFGRVGVGAPGPVFAVPGAVSAALTNLVTAVAHNPPPGEAGWAHPAPGRLPDIDGFLRYGATCLNLINQTAAGATLLTGLSMAAFPIFISPGLMSNQTFAGGIDGAVDTLTRAARQYGQGGPTPKAAIDAAVQAQYAHIGGKLGKYNQLAADMNAAPLYSLFVPGANFQPNYLNARFRFRGARLTGQNLMNWLSAGGFATFDGAVRSMSVAQPDGVVLRDFFLLAMCVALHPSALPGPGAGAGIKFYLQNEGDNLLGSPGFRPPAIGLAHELMHARHYTRGTSPGYDINHFSTTGAELMFAGIGPSATDPVSENAVRGQWAGIAGPVDPSNVWAVPAQRLVYEPPVLPQTARTMRLAMRCI